MSIAKRGIVTFIASLAATGSAAAVETDETLCPIYGTLGSSLSEFMLPLTMQDFVNIMTGKDEKLANELSNSLLSQLTGVDLMTLNKLGEKRLEIFSESAGQVAIQHLMSGSASSSKEVYTLMETTCLSVGASTIIDNQELAKKATEANMGR